MSISQELAGRVLAVRYEDLPPDAVRWARIAVLDTVGVLLAGSVQETAAILRRVVLPAAGAGPSLVFGTERRVNMCDAALANGVAAHVLDYDDSNSQLHGHPSGMILPALFAAADAGRISGRDFLRAYVAGFETLARIGMGVSRRQYTWGWHPTATVGIFGATAACGVALGLTAAQMAHAFAIATHMASGVKSNFGSMTKSFGVGHGGRNALLAVQLAREGYSGGEHAFEHPHGYLNVFNGPDNYDVGRMLDGWGEPWCVLETGLKHKRFPCCYACLPPVDGLLALVAEYGLTPANVARIDCAVHAIRYPHINVPDPQTALGAKFSVHYCLARALVNGGLAIGDFENDAHLDPAVRALMQRVGFKVYDRDNPSGAVVRVTMTNGRTVETYVETALGASYARALSPALLKQKFDDCAQRVLTRPASDTLHAALQSLESVDDMTAVTRIIEDGLARGAEDMPCRTS